MDKLSFCAHRSTDVGICMGRCASRRRLSDNKRFNGCRYRGRGVAYATDFLVCRMHFPHDCTVGVGALICSGGDRICGAASFEMPLTRDLRTRALTSRTEGFPCMMRTTLIAKRSKKNKPMKGENAGDRMMSGQHKKSD